MAFSKNSVINFMIFVVTVTCIPSNIWADEWKFVPHRFIRMRATPQELDLKACYNSRDISRKEIAYCQSFGKLDRAVAAKYRALMTDKSVALEDFILSEEEQMQVLANVGLYAVGLALAAGVLTQALFPKIIKASNVFTMSMLLATLGFGSWAVYQRYLGRRNSELALLLMMDDLLDEKFKRGPVRDISDRDGELGKVLEIWKQIRGEAFRNGPVELEEPYILYQL